MAEEAKSEQLAPAPKRRIEQKRENYEKGTRERQEAAQALKIEYKKVKDSPAIKHLLVKMRQFADWHTKVAKDGVGFVDKKDESGLVIDQEVTFLAPEKRLQELDRAAGIEEIITYLEGQLAEPDKPEVAAQKS